MGLIDVLTVYGARKRAAHAAKTMKHGVSLLISMLYHIALIMNFVAVQWTAFLTCICCLSWLLRIRTCSFENIIVLILGLKCSFLRHLL